MIQASHFLKKKKKSRNTYNDQQLNKNSNKMCSFNFSPFLTLLFKMHGGLGGAGVKEYPNTSFEDLHSALRVGEMGAIGNVGGDRGAAAQNSICIRSSTPRRRSA